MQKLIMVSVYHIHDHLSHVVGWNFLNPFYGGVKHL